MSLSGCLARLEEKRRPSPRDPETRLKEILALMTDKELVAYAAALDNALDGEGPDAR